MKMYLTFNKKFLCVILCLMILAVCVASRFSEVEAESKNGDTNLKRTEFLNSIGCIVADYPATKKTVVIPVDFSDVYENYNRLQNTAGYDLSLYKGEESTVYSFRIKKYKDFSEKDNATANLIVYKGRIIGGDISSPQIDGRMYPLKK